MFLQMVGFESHSGENNRVIIKRILLQLGFEKEKHFYNN